MSLAVQREVSSYQKFKFRILLNKSNFIVDLYYAFQTQDELYLAMDLCVGGTLFYFLNQLEPGIKNEQVAKFYLAEIIIAMEFIHSKNVIYRDLKPENVLIDIDGHIKIADFGLAKKLRHKDDLSSTFWGSPEYLAPEMLLGVKHTRKVDFYTLGWLSYELLIGIPPYYAEDKQEMAREIITGNLFFPKGVSEEAQDLMRWILNKDPRKRPSEMSEVKNHKFFEDIHWGKFMKKQVVPPWLPNLYNWHYNPKFMDIPLAQVFGEKFEQEELQERGSFYIELNTDSILIDKISLLDFDYTSIVGQEKSAGRIYESTDWKEYLEDFDFEQDPDEEIYTKEQIKGYKEKYKKVLKLSSDEVKTSDSEDESYHFWDTDETNLNSLNVNKIKKSMISERMYGFRIDKKERKKSIVSSIIRQNLSSVKKGRKVVNSSFYTVHANPDETVASTVSHENDGHARDSHNFNRFERKISLSPRKLNHTKSIIPKHNTEDYEEMKNSTDQNDIIKKKKKINKNYYKKYLNRPKTTKNNYERYFSI